VEADVVETLDVVVEVNEEEEEVEEGTEVLEVDVVVDRLELEVDENGAVVEDDVIVEPVVVDELDCVRAKAAAAAAIIRIITTITTATVRDMAVLFVDGLSTVRIGHCDLSVSMCLFLSGSEFSAFLQSSSCASSPSLRPKDLLDSRENYRPHSSHGIRAQSSGAC